VSTAVIEIAISPASNPPGSPGRHLITGSRTRERQGLVGSTVCWDARKIERGRRLRSALAAATARPVRDQPPGLWHG